MLVFGGSDGPDAGIDMWQVVDLLADFAKARLGQGPAHFVRLSAGGMILQHFAAAHPEMARSITILDSSPKFDFGGNIEPADFANPILES